MNFSSKVISTVNSFLTEYDKWLVIIRWATATWKSKYSLELSEHFDTEIVSADSRQIYKYMDIWTDKVNSDFRKSVPHHQLDLVEPNETYTAWQRQHDSEKIINNILSKKKMPVVVWGTWLYIDSLYSNYTMPEVLPDFELRKKFEDMEIQKPWTLYDMLYEKDPDEAQKINRWSTRFLIRALEIIEKTWRKKSNIVEKSEPKRPILMIWLWREKEDTNKLINSRVKKMIEKWLLDEVKWLLDKWYNKDLPSMSWIWYRELINYYFWEITLDKAIEQIKRNTHKYAKRQRTWFRRYIVHEKNFPQKNVTYLHINLS